MAHDYIFPYRIYQIDDMGPDENPEAVGYIPVYDSITALVNDHGNDCPSGTLPKKYEVLK